MEDFNWKFDGQAQGVSENGAFENESAKLLTNASLHEVVELQHVSGVTKEEESNDCESRFWNTCCNEDIDKRYDQLSEFPNNCGYTTLHIAAKRNDAELCLFILDKDLVDVNATDIVGATPLHEAIKAGAVDCVKILLEKGADVYLYEDEGELPIHCAARTGKSELVRCLIVKGRADSCNMAKVGMERMINIPNLKRKTPLHIACREGHDQVVKTLLLEDVEVSVVDSSGKTPLHEACCNGSLSTSKSLIESGAEMNVRDSEGSTPLIEAIKHGHTAVAEYLIKHGADMKCGEAYTNRTVIHLASEDKLVDTLRMLLKNGGDILINIRDILRHTPLERAAMTGNNEALNVLLDFNPSCDVGTFFSVVNKAMLAGNSKSCFAMIGAFPKLSMVKCKRDRSLLHIGAMYNAHDLCKHMIGLGVEMNSRDLDDMSPMDYAARRGHTEVLQLLIGSGASLVSAGKNKMTALHYAAAHGNLRSCEILMENSLSAFDRNRNGKSCLDLAVEKFHGDVCRAFIGLKQIRFLDPVVPKEKMIECTPVVFSEMLGRGIWPSDHEKSHLEFRITYFFNLIEDWHGSPEPYYFGPALMVKYGQDDLLCHPLTRMLISEKWSRLMLWFYIPSMMVYLVFLAVLTALVLLLNDKYEATPEVDPGSRLKTALLWITFALTIVHIIKEVIELKYRNWSYLLDPVNWLEVVLFSTTLVFTGLLICEEYYRSIPSMRHVKWQISSLSILLAWSNLLLYFKRFPIVGFYVVIFGQVLKRVLKVLLAFGCLFVGFGLAFFNLLSWQQNFSVAGYSIVKTAVMTLGELDYDAIFTENLAKDAMRNEEMAVAIFLFFLVILPIVIMNLLIGLAVGDIRAVQQTSDIQMLKMQSLMIADVEKGSRWLRKKAHVGSVEVRPNAQGFMTRLLRKLKTYNSDLNNELLDNVGSDKGNIQQSSGDDKIREMKEILMNITQAFKDTDSHRELVGRQEARLDKSIACSNSLLSDIGSNVQCLQNELRLVREEQTLLREEMKAIKGHHKERLEQLSHIIEVLHGKCGMSASVERPQADL